uniref:Uncharacterized protein n=1 Tax=Anguilla anguilla TaxID=7936 RepID=A0A0E9RP45_ANGAN
MFLNLIIVDVIVKPRLKWFNVSTIAAPVIIMDKNIWDFWQLMQLPC